MNTAGIAMTILLATFTGWLITWFATNMLFYPAKPFHLVGFSIQGLFPKKQNLIAEKLARLVSEEVRSFSSLEGKISDAENLQKIKPDIEAHIDDFLRHKLKEVFPMLAMIMGEKTILQLKAAFLAELDVLFPVVMKAYIGNLQQDFDVEKIILEKITGFLPQKMHGMLKAVLKREFQRVQIIGMSIGFIMGMVQVFVAFLVQK